MALSPDFTPSRARSLVEEKVLLSSASKGALEEGKGQILSMQNEQTF